MKHNRAICSDCKTEFEYKIMDIFTHWDFPYVLCPKCAEIVLVKEKPNEICVERHKIMAKVGKDNE